MKIIETLGCFLEELGGCLIYKLCEAGVFTHYIRLWGMGFEGFGVLGVPVTWPIQSWGLQAFSQKLKRVLEVLVPPPP